MERIDVTHFRSRAIRRRFSFVWLVPVVAGLPALYLAVRGATNEFLYQTLALVAYSLNKPHIAEGLGHDGFNLAAMQEKFPAYQSMLLAICQTTGLSPQHVQFLPLGTVAIGVTLYALARAVLTARRPAVLLTLAMLCDVSFMASEYSVFVYAWTYSLFLLYILLMVKLSQEGRSPATLTLVLVVFLAVYFYHYTMPLWMIVWGICLLGITQSTRLRTSAGLPDRARGAQGIVIACLVFYASFNQLLYDTFIRQLSRDDATSESTFTFTARLLAMLGTQEPPRLPHAYIEPASLYGILRLLYLGLLPVAVGAGLLLIGWRLLRGHREPGINWLVVLGVPSIAVLVLDMGTYAGFGIVSTKFLTLMFPLLAVLAAGEIWRTLRGRAQGLSAALFLMLNILSFGFFGNNPRLAPRSTYAQVEPSARWLFAEAGEQPRVLGDLHLLGRYLLAGSTDGRFIQPCYWSPEIYDGLTGQPTPGSTLPDCDFVAVDVRSAEQPLAAPGWKWYEPIKPYLAHMDANPRLRRAYSDPTVVIYRVHRER